MRTASSPFPTVLTVASAISSSIASSGETLAASVILSLRGNCPSASFSTYSFSARIVSFSIAPGRDAVDSVSCICARFLAAANRCSGLKFTLAESSAHLYACLFQALRIL